MPASTLARHIFEGQVLTCALVVVLYVAVPLSAPARASDIVPLSVAIFLFREWVLQNMPQPIEELAGDDAAAGVPPHDAARGRAEAPDAAEPAAQGALPDVPSPLLRAARMDDADMSNFVARVQQLSAQLEASRARQDEDSAADPDADAAPHARPPHGELALISALAEDEIDLAAVRAARLDRFAPRQISLFSGRPMASPHAAADVPEAQDSSIDVAARDAASTHISSARDDAETSSPWSDEPRPQETALPAALPDKGKGRAFDQGSGLEDMSGTANDAGGSVSSRSSPLASPSGFAELDISESRELDPDVTVDPRFSPKGASDFVSLNEDGQGDRWGSASTSSHHPPRGPVPQEEGPAAHIELDTDRAAAAADAQPRAEECPAVPEHDRPVDPDGTQPNAAHDDDEEEEAEDLGGEPDEEDAGQEFDVEVWEEEGDAEEAVGGAPLDEDLEGMMEAIGMRGPLSGLAANVSLMYVLCK